LVWSNIHDSVFLLQDAVVSKSTKQTNAIDKNNFLIIGAMLSFETNAKYIKIKSDSVGCFVGW
jgi:hypothetical protein